MTVWGSEAWGLSWAIDKVDGVRQISHGGGTKGQITLLALIPERDFAIDVLTNAIRVTLGPRGRPALARAGDALVCR